MASPLRIHPVLIAAYVCLAFASVHADELIVLRSGNGPANTDDTEITYLLGPQSAPFPTVFDANDFADARSGPPARIRGNE